MDETRDFRWVCRCGDEAEVYNENEAIAGAAMHFLRKESPKCRSVHALRPDYRPIIKVRSQSEAMLLRARHLSGFAVFCCESKWRGYLCACTNTVDQIFRGSPHGG